MVAATPRRLRARTPASWTPSRVLVTSDGVEVTLETDPDDNGTWTTEYDGTFDHPSGHATVTYEHADAGNLTFDGVYRYGYDAWSEIEERNGSNLVLRQQVWGLDYIDELVVVSTNLNPQSGSSSQDPDPQQCDVDHYAVLDAQFNVLGLIGVELEQAVALVNGGSFSGSPYQTVRQTTAQNPQGSWPIVVVERYEYTPYGQRQVYRGSDNDRKAYAPYLASARLGSLGHSLNPFGHQGLKHDEGIGLVYNRARMLHPGLGRFVQRDPLGYVDGMSSYSYYAGLHGELDPTGLSMGRGLPRSCEDILGSDKIASHTDRMKKTDNNRKKQARDIILKRDDPGQSRNYAKALRRFEGYNTSMREMCNSAVNFLEMAAGCPELCPESRLAVDTVKEFARRYCEGGGGRPLPGVIRHPTYVENFNERWANDETARAFRRAGYVGLGFAGGVKLAPGLGAAASGALAAGRGGAAIRGAGALAVP